MYAGRSSTRGKAFTPSLSIRSDSLAGISTPFPSVGGYVVTADRPGLAQVSIRGPENDPILAQWQHGLGHVTVFTSDASTRWNQEWTGWSDFNAFWRQQLAWTMRAPGDPFSRVTIAPDGDSSNVIVELFSEAGDPLSFAALRARLVGASSEIVFRQTGPGKYEARAAAEKPGVHLLSIEYSAPEGRRGSLRAAIVKREGDELRNPTPNRDLLNQAATLTRGRIYTLNPGGADLWSREHLVFPVTSRPVWLLAVITGLGLFLLGCRLSADRHRPRAARLPIPRDLRRRTGRTLGSARLPQRGEGPSRGVNEAVPAGAPAE